MGTAAGLSGAGISSGLAAIGALVGGGMAAGIVVAATTPPGRRCCRLHDVQGWPIRDASLTPTRDHPFRRSTAPQRLGELTAGE